MNGPTGGAVCGTEPSAVNPSLEKRGKRTSPLGLYFLHFLSNLLENRDGFPFRDEDKRKLHVSREETWTFNVNFVTGEQSVFPVSLGLCPY